MNKKLQVSKYLFFDILSAAISWFLFFIYRKNSVYPYFFDNFYDQVFNDNNFYKGIIIIPIYWLILYTFTGFYRKIYRKSRIKELEQTLIITLIGTIILFFAIIIDDIIINYKNLLEYFFVLLALHFFISYFPRLIITSITVNKIHKGKLGFNTILLGNNEIALKILNESNKKNIKSGNKFIGYLSLNEDERHLLDDVLPKLGNIQDINIIVKKYNIEEIIIAAQDNNRNYVETILSLLDISKIVIKIIPKIEDIILGNVKMTSVLQEPLIQLYPDLMPLWQQVVKNFMDKIVSLISLVILSPIFLILAIAVKITSKGPIFFKQERIGIHSKPFYIIKFRSMYIDAEKYGPQLSSKFDSRITSIGKIIRKTRLDEIPQFYNVLIGDMSLVGPRPERKFFIEQIIKVAPHYRLMSKVKPGITSWGQVKYGYAENIEQMVERLKYDLVYIENMSLQMDLKILIYTIKIIFQRRGK